MAAVASMARMAAWLACDREISMAAMARVAACDGEISMAAVARIAAGLKVFIACSIYIVLLI